MDDGHRSDLDADAKGGTRPNRSSTVDATLISAHDLVSVQRLLVMRPGAIGDTLLTLPALVALRRRFPGASIEAVGNETALPLAASSGLVDRVIGFDDPRVTRLFMAREPSPDDHFSGIDLAVAWGRDPDGVLQAGLRCRGARSVLVAPSLPDAGQPEHVAQHLLRSLAPLGIAIEEAMASLPPIVVPPDAAAIAGAELATAGLDQRPFVAIHPGSGSPRKNWPAEQFAQVADVLRTQHGVATVVFGGPADAAAVQVLHDRADAGGPLVVERPLLIVAALLRRAAAFLGNDSGLSHLAGLLGVPTLALFGPSDPTLWSPLGPRVRVVRSPSLASLPAEDVLTELQSLMRTSA